jgi:hypothetical protein
MKTQSSIKINNKLDLKKGMILCERIIKIGGTMKIK